MSQLTENATTERSKVKKNSFSNILSMSRAVETKFGIQIVSNNALLIDVSHYKTNFLQMSPKIEKLPDKR